MYNHPWLIAELARDRQEELRRANGAARLRRAARHEPDYRYRRRRRRQQS